VSWTGGELIRECGAERRRILQTVAGGAFGAVDVVGVFCAPCV
jgi:hypothetical protein